MKTIKMSALLLHIPIVGLMYVISLRISNGGNFIMNMGRYTHLLCFTSAIIQAVSIFVVVLGLTCVFTVI